jgi:hypothetical protein
MGMMNKSTLAAIAAAATIAVGVSHAQSIPKFPSSFSTHVYLPTPEGRAVYNLAISHELNTMEFGSLGGPPEDAFAGYQYYFDFATQKSAYSFMNATDNMCFGYDIGPTFCNTTAKVTLADKFWVASKPLGKQKGCGSGSSEETLFCWNGTTTLWGNCPKVAPVSLGMFDVYCWPADGAAPYLPTCAAMGDADGSLTYYPMTISAADPSPMSRRSLTGCSTWPPTEQAPTFFKRLVRQ